MPYRSWEESAPGSEPEHPVTPTKASRNDGTSLADPDPAVPAALSEQEEVLGATKIRPPRHDLKYEVVQLWVTGEKAEKDEAVITTELEDSMREYMELSGQRKFLGHRSRPIDKGLWKIGRSHTDKRGVTNAISAVARSVS